MRTASYLPRLVPASDLGSGRASLAQVPVAWITTLAAFILTAYNALTVGFHALCRSQSRRLRCCLSATIRDAFTKREHASAGSSLHLPPLNEQTAIATVLSDMDAEIAALEARRDKTRALKQGMMQELLTGRIRAGMSIVGQIEKKTQARVVALFRDRLGYDYLGNWNDRAGNAQHRAGAADAPGCESRASSDEPHQPRAARAGARRPATPARASTTATATSTTCCATA